MTSPQTLAWYDANQDYLNAAVASVRKALERHVGDGRGKERPSREPVAGMTEPPPALEALCAAFGLSAFERDVLLACAGVELDSAFAACCAAAQGDSRRAYPTFGLALAGKGIGALIEDPHLRAGLNVHRGQLTNRAVADSQNLPAAAPETILAA